MKIVERIKARIKRAAEGDMPVETGLYFYLIIILSLTVPILITVCVMFMDIVVGILLAAFVILIFVLIGICIGFYRKVRRQFEEFQHVVENLDLLEGDHEISVLGGLFSLRIEEAPKQLPPGPLEEYIPEIVDDKTNDN